MLTDTLGRMASHAADVGIGLYLEPLNRYEDHVVNRLKQGIALIEAIGVPTLGLVADTCHMNMNIGEADLVAALHRTAPCLDHSQASDSDRVEPGAGHLAWADMCGALRDIDYAGDIAVESWLSGPAAKVLPRVPALLRAFL